MKINVKYQQFKNFWLQTLKQQLASDFYYCLPAGIPSPAQVEMQQSRY